MKKSKLITLLVIFSVLNGCAGRISNERQDGRHRHSRVSIVPIVPIVPILTHGSGRSTLGALIIGGIIGAVINEISHESNEKELNKDRLESKQKEEKIPKENNSEEYLDRERLNSGDVVTKWYQLGKDNQCYEMQTKSGITDVLASVDSKYCNP